MIEKNPISKFDRADFRVAILRRLGSRFIAEPLCPSRVCIGDARRGKVVVPILENGKKLVEKMTGWQRPSKKDLERLRRPRKGNTFHFKDDGIVPNHPYWPLVVYRSAAALPIEFDPAPIFEDLFKRNDWKSSWRNGIYDYVHYHSRIHEVLGIARGSAKVQFGGKRGRTLTIKAGDVAVLPAGTGHQCLGASEDFLVVGAYPPDGSYDECTSSEDHAHAVQNIRGVVKPRKDPVYGGRGPLVELWTVSRRARTMR
jgi:uncharacterized protein YjlB